MCGIVGIASKSGDNNIPAGLVEKMNDLISHRGPDGSGIFFGEGFSMGHKRLSIIDLAGGAQPMLNSDQSIVVSYNGEIYNYRTLRDQLEKEGHRFRTESDTEVLLHGYEQWGMDLVMELEGMFAFALWEKNKRRLILARDRLGVKPLYWTLVNDQLIFASEIKSILACPNVERRANPDAISSYLTFRQSVGDQTFFQGIERLSPGHYLIFENGLLKKIKYFELPLNQNEEDLGENFYLEKTTELLRESISKRMMSDVPLGAFLSGGLDSSLLVASMSKERSDPVKTFSIGYDVDGYNEGKFAKIASEHCKSSHHEIKLKQKDFFDEWSSLIQKRDTPLSIPHEIPLYQMSKELKKHITVVLSGEGADELFGGYGRVQRSPMDWKKVVFAKKILGSSIVEGMARRFPKSHYFRQFEKISHMDHFFNAYNWIPFEEKWDLFSNDFNDQIQKDKKTIGFFSQIFDEIQHIDPYDRVLHVFEKVHLSCLLERLDMMTMAASVEARVPFVDNQELLEFVIKMPFKYKIRWKSIFSRARATVHSSFKCSDWLDTNKYLLRKIGSSYLPPEIAYRKKLGFPTPLDIWMKGDMKKMAKEVLLDPASVRRGVFNSQKIEMLLNNTQKLPYDFYGKKIWMLMNVEIWLQNFFKD